MRACYRCRRTALQPQGVRARTGAGFTLAEMMVVIGIGTVMALTLASLLITTFRVFGQEMRQNEVNLRGRSLGWMLSRDVQAASQVVYTGAARYTVSGSTTLPPSSYTGALSQNLVFQAPSYNSSGIISGSSDYISYTYDSTTQKVTRSVLAAAGSSRTTLSAVLAEGGFNVQSVTFQFHLASTAPVGTSPGVTYTFGSAPVGSRLQDIDEVILSATIQEQSYGQNVTSRFTTAERNAIAAKLRNWRQG